MLLQLRPIKHNGAEQIAGMLIRGAGPEYWLRAIKGSGLSLNTCTSYAIPGLTPQTIWGCLILGGDIEPRHFPPTVTFVTAVCNRLFIPVDSYLHPSITKQELEALLPDGLHLLHPETNLVPLEQELSWADIINLPVQQSFQVMKPVPPVFLPSLIKSFQLKAQSPEENIHLLEQRITPEQKTFDDKPLSVFEKIKLGIYRKLFETGDSTIGQREKGKLLQKLEHLAARLGQTLPGIERMVEDFESLERRNASEIDKLLDMLKRNPEEALKYAIPLGDGSSRGDAGPIQLSRRWGSFSLFGNSNGGGNGPAARIPETYQQKLFREYNQTAEALIRNCEFEKAAFVYLKLLKNYHKAAETLEQGKLHAEAAAIHLKYTGNKLAAAECYVKANMISKAIELFEEAGKHEAVGDLYMKLSQRANAMKAYQKVVEGYISANRFLKAANLKKDKMHDLPEAQDLLLQGWRQSADSFSCLQTYCLNIDDSEELLSAIQSIYRYETSERNMANLLAVLKKQTGRFESLHAPLRTIAIEIIASRVRTDPSIISELRFFNKKNSLISKDIMRYKTSK